MFKPMQKHIPPEQAGAMKSGKECFAYFCPYICFTRDISACRTPRTGQTCVVFALFEITDSCNELGIWLVVLRMSHGISERCRD